MRGFVDCGCLAPLLPVGRHVLDAGRGLLHVRGSHSGVQLAHLPVHVEESASGMG